MPAPPLANISLIVFKGTRSVRRNIFALPLTHWKRWDIEYIVSFECQPLLTGRTVQFKWCWYIFVLDITALSYQSVLIGALIVPFERPIIEQKNAYSIS